MKLCHFGKMDGTGDQHVKRDKPGLKKQILHTFSYAESKSKKVLKVEGGDCGGT
jgi:hypothetical protein